MSYDLCCDNAEAIAILSYLRDRAMDEDFGKDFESVKDEYIAEAENAENSNFGPWLLTLYEVKQIHKMLLKK